MSSPTDTRWDRQLLVAALLFNLALVCLTLLADGYHLAGGWLPQLTTALMLLTVGVGLARDLAELRGRLDRLQGLRRQVLEWSSLLALLLLLAIDVDLETLRWAAALRQAALSVRLLGRTGPGRLVGRHLAEHPARLLTLSFAALIGIGTVMLTLPTATLDGRGTPLVDALFTAVSATCVTGLAVRDTGTYFSLQGQVVILGLIQVGGLGIMTLSGSAVVLFGRRLGLRSRALLAEALELDDLAALQGLMVYIVKMTALIEAGGALLLFFRFLQEQPAAEAAFNAIFHAVSAFCNAGFSTWSDSLVRYRGDLVVNLVIATLVVAGGLGFVVIATLTGRGRRRRAAARGTSAGRMSAHVKMVLQATVALLLLGAIGFYFFEYHNTLGDLPVPEKLLGAAFSSVTARTAGFNTVEISALGGPAVLLLVVLMFVGGAPGSTAGGIKVTTAGVLMLAVRAMLAGRDEVENVGRTIPKAVVYKAVAITVIAFLLVVVMFGLLLFTQQGSFQALLFETVSAFGTVGLSMGITTTLTVTGKLLVIALMFAGRTGPLTMALAIGESHQSGRYRLPSESVLVG